jgi:hypothetical protein
MISSTTLHIFMLLELVMGCFVGGEEVREKYK